MDTIHPGPGRRTLTRLTPSRIAAAALIVAVAALFTLLTASSASAQGIAPGLLEFDTATSCLSGSGRVDVTVTNTTDTQADFDVTVGTVGPRTLEIAPGASTVNTVTGRPDGPLTVTVSSTAVAAPTTLSETLTLTCGPQRDTFEVETSCLAGRGRVDMWVTSATWPAAPTGVGTVDWTLSLVGADPATGEALLNPLIREIQLAEGHGPTRVSITGRADGPWIATATADPGNPAIDVEDIVRIVEVDCFDEPSSFITSSCLAGNGRVDVYLSNTDDVGTFEVTVGSLEPRSITLQPGRTGRITVTGRPDGFLDIDVTRNGDVYLGQQVEIVCDIVGTRITLVNNGPTDLGLPSGPMVGVTVTIQDLAAPGAVSYEVVTDENGQAVIDLDPSQYRFVANVTAPNDSLCSYSAYETQTVSGTFTDVVLPAVVACALPFE